MSFLSQYNPKTRHFITICFVLLLYCCQTIVSAKGKQNQNMVSVRNATRREDSLIFDTLSKILPEDVGRIQVPSNYLTIFLNAAGVLGLGFLWIKELTNAIGTPILAPILSPPLIVLSAALLLIPDLSKLGEIIDQI